jgi:hypothetical protein
VASPDKSSSARPQHLAPAPRNNQRKLKRFFQDIEIPLIASLAVISILLGVIGFQKHAQHNGDSRSILSSFYSSLTLFVFEGGSVTSPVPWELEVSRLLSPATTLYAALLGFAALFRDQLKNFGLPFLKKHAIICGLGQKGLNIAKDFHRNGRKVVIIEQDGNNPFLSLCRELDIIVLIGDARDDIVLRKAGVTKARNLIAVCGDDGINSDISVLAYKIVTGHVGSRLNCTIHVKDPDLWVFFRKQEFTSNQGDSFRLDIFNIYDQGAKQLFQEHPLLPPTGEKQPSNHLLIVGFGGFAEQLILNAARLWSPYFDVNRQKLHIALIDPQAEMHVCRLRQEYSLIDQVCEWELHPFDTNSIDFLKAEFLFNQDHQPDISMILVTIEDENISLRTALMLLDRVRNFDVRIFIQMSEAKGLASLIRETNLKDGSFNNLYMFGLMERTCKLDLIYNSSHEAIARAIHTEYLHQEELKGNRPASSPALVPWDRLSEDLKEMNRTQAHSIGEKLRIVACDIAPWRDYNGDKFSFKLEEIEILAKLEHERWVRQKQQQGWKYAIKRNDARKEHPSLIAWDAPHFSEEEKDKDRNTVRQIPNLLALAGYQIYRLRP